MKIYLQQHKQIDKYWRYSSFFKTLQHNLIVYNKDNWSEIAEFCSPFTIQRTKKGKDNGRAIVDLPTGNEAFEHGMLLVRLGKKRILSLQPSEFEKMFELDPQTASNYSPM